MRSAIVGTVGALAGALLALLLSSPDPAPAPDHRPGAGAGAGFARTEDGAALAAAAYQQAFASEEILRPGELRRRVEEVATPRFAPTMLQANAPGTARLARGPFGRGVRAGTQSVFLAVPVSWEVLSFSPDRAVVRTWGFTLLGNTGSVEPSAWFGFARTVLVWSEGRWRIDFNRAGFGPTPRLATARPGGEGLGLVEVGEEMSRYGVAP